MYIYRHENVSPAEIDEARGKSIDENVLQSERTQHDVDGHDSSRHALETFGVDLQATEKCEIE